MPDIEKLYLAGRVAAAALVRPAAAFAYRRRNSAGDACVQ